MKEDVEVDGVESGCDDVVDRPDHKDADLHGVVVQGSCAS